MLKELYPVQPLHNFRFQLTKEEYDDLRSQIVTSNGSGGRRYRPYMFTEQGIAMLSGILRSDIAISLQEVADSIGLSSRGVKKICNKLQEYGMLERIGSKRDGIWKTK